MRPVELAIVELGLALGLVLPHEAFIRQDLADPEGNADPRVPVPPARLDQEDAQVRSLAEPARQRAAGRSRTDNDVVIRLVAHQERALSGAPSGMAAVMPRPGGRSA